MTKCKEFQTLLYLKLYFQESIQIFGFTLVLPDLEGANLSSSLPLETCGEMEESQQSQDKPSDLRLNHMQNVPGTLNTPSVLIPQLASQQPHTSSLPSEETHLKQIN